MEQSAHLEETYSLKSNKISDLFVLFFLGIGRSYLKMNLSEIATRNNHGRIAPSEKAFSSGDVIMLTLYRIIFVDNLVSFNRKVYSELDRATSEMIKHFLEGAVGVRFASLYHNMVHPQLQC